MSNVTEAFKDYVRKNPEYEIYSPGKKTDKKTNVLESLI